MKINPERLQRRMDEINSIAVTPDGGMMRLALGEADKQARDLLVAWMREAGMVVRIDDMGSIYGYMAGSDPSAKPIASGSHMDTQPNGGKYDGFFGVMAALEAVCSIKDAGITTRSPLVVVDWTNEEGARFSPPMIASGVVSGHFEKEWAHAVADADGITIGEAINAIGYAGDKANRLTSAKALVEAHIEQGPVLEMAGLKLGVVDAVLGITGLVVTIRGEADHAGPTPMATRKDALMIAAEAMLAVKSFVEDFGDPAVATIGTISVEPSSRNVIPGVARFTIDMRYHTNEGLVTMEKEITALVEKITLSRGGRCEIERYWKADPVAFDAGVVEVLENAVKRTGVPYRRMTSGAGHDAVFASAIMPTAMLFIPSIGGKSHCPEEECRFQDIVAGTEVLAQVILDLDEMAE